MIAPLLLKLLNIFSIMIFVWVALSWVISFGIVSPQNKFVGMLYYSLARIIEPVLKPFRQIIPPINGLDLSPILLIFAIQFLSYFLASANF